VSTAQQQLAQEVHARQLRLVLAVTGGGSQAISTLLSEPGASRSILEATVPYAAESLTAWLGGEPEDYCSARTGRAMAMAAYLKARAIDPLSATGGVGCTASLASDRPKRGAHRAHVAWQTAGTTAAKHLELLKGQRSRAEEEALVAGLVLNAVAEASGAAARIELPLLEGERIEEVRVDAPADEQDLLAGSRLIVPRGAASLHQRPRAIFPGAFHPLHAAHRLMADVARQRLHSDVAFELSIENVDKLPLDFVETDERVKQFDSRDAVWLTRAPTFVRKAELFPGCTFVVGADTIERVGQSRYYGSEQAMLAAIAAISAQGCRFLVFGRDRGGAFRTISALGLPAPLAALCDEVPEEAFRADISSTALRNRAKQTER
jgi:nicotinamide mononucleotide (NMN) deamidase PncC/nicotinic acid mononucleotide adenylyltransferase